MKEKITVRTLINAKTKAIVAVHYGGILADLTQLKGIAEEWNIPVIEDAAQAIGAVYKGNMIGSIFRIYCVFISISKDFNNC